MLINIKHLNTFYGILLRAEYNSSGIEFFTNDEDPLQLGYMNRKKGYLIQPHLHNKTIRTVNFTNEVIFLKSGKVRVDFFDSRKIYLFSYTLYKGDVLLLSSGGHGFEMLEDSELIEVKQGPYVGDDDKTRFKFSPSESHRTNF